MCILVIYGWQYIYIFFPILEYHFVRKKQIILGFLKHPVYPESHGNTDTDTDTDTLLTKKAWASQGINDIHVQMAQMSVYKITYY